MSGNLFQHRRIPEASAGYNGDGDFNHHERPVTPESTLNGFDFSHITRAPQKRFQSPILKTKVAPNDFGEIEKNDFVVVKSNSNYQTNQLKSAPSSKCGSVGKSQPHVQPGNSVNETKPKTHNNNKISSNAQTLAESSNTRRIEWTEEPASNQNLNSTRSRGSISRKNLSSQLGGESAIIMPSNNKNKSTKSEPVQDSIVVLHSVVKCPESSTSVKDCDHEEIVSRTTCDRTSKVLCAKQNESGDGNLIRRNPSDDEKLKKKPVYYKSKFWDYVVPNKNAESKSSRQEKGKKYDQTQVRDFMEKQKEIRRSKEKREEEEKRRLQEKKKSQLQELEKKRKDLLKPSVVKKEPLPPTLPYVQQTPAHVRSSPRSSLTRSSLTPMKALRPSVMENGKSASAFRTSLILHEFENIVHNECLNVMKNHADKLKGLQNCAKVDKAVETTMSLLLDQETSSPRASLTKSLKSTVGSPLKQSVRRVSAGAIRNSAATKIQSVYRGYKVRKVLKAADLLPGQRSRSRRRSFYRASEKPVDINVKNLIKLSPPNFALNQDVQDRQYYIPPPAGFSPSLTMIENKFLEAPSSQNSRSSRSSISLSRYDERFPKEAIRQLQNRAGSPNEPRRLSLGHHRVGNEFSPESHVKPAGIDRRMSLRFDYPLPLARPFDVGTVDIPVPTFSTVLKEKIRLLQEKTLKSTCQQPAPSPRKSQIPHSFEPPRQRRSEEIHLYDSDTMSERSYKENRQQVVGDAPGQENYIGPAAADMQRAYLIRKAKRSEIDSLQAEKAKLGKDENNLSSQRQLDNAKIVEDSGESEPTSTTVETDVELRKRDKRKQEMRQERKSGGERVSSSTTYKSYPIPALELAFKAEKERLNILDQALQTNLVLDVASAQRDAQRIAAQQAKAVENQSQKLNSNLSTTNANNSNSEVLVQLARCQAEQLKATAEVIKWVSELRKSSSEHEAPKPLSVPSTIKQTEGEKELVQQKVLESPQKHYEDASQRSEDEMNQFSSEYSTHDNETYESDFESESSLLSKPSAKSSQRLEINERLKVQDKDTCKKLAVSGKTVNNEEIIKSVPELRKSYIEQELQKSFSTRSPSIRTVLSDQEDVLKSPQTSNRDPTDEIHQIFSENWTHDNEQIETDIESEVSELRKSIKQEAQKPISIPSTSIHTDESEKELVQEEVLESLETTLDKDSPQRPENEMDQFPSENATHDKEPIETDIESETSEFRKSYIEQEVQKPMTMSSTSIHPDESQKEMVQEEVLESSQTQGDYVTQRSEDQINQILDENSADDKEPIETDFESEVSELRKSYIEQEVQKPISIPSTAIHTDESEKEMVEVEEVVESPSKHDDDASQRSEDQMNQLFKEDSTDGREPIETDIELEVSELRKSSTEHEAQKRIGIPSTDIHTVEGEKELVEEEVLESPQTHDKYPPQKSEDQVNFFSENLKDDKEPIEYVIESEVSELSKSSLEQEAQKSIGIGIHTVEGEKELVQEEVLESPQTLDKDPPDWSEDEVNQISSENSTHDKEPYESDFESESLSLSKPSAKSSQELEINESLNVKVEDRGTWKKFASSGETVNKVAENILARLLSTVIKEGRESLEGIEPHSAKSIQTRISEILKGIPDYSRPGKEDKQPWGSFLTPSSLVDDYTDGEKLPDIEDEYFEDDLVSSSADAAEEKALREEAAKNAEEQKRIDNEIRALLASREIPDKPPPPYGSPPSSGSSSLSVHSRFFTISFDEHKLREIISWQLENEWVLENQTFKLLNVNTTTPAVENSGSTTADNLSMIAARSFDALLLDTARKIIPEVLQIDSEINKPFIDKIRPGNLALEAQRQRIPRSKEQLIPIVFKKFLEVIPTDLAMETMSPNLPIRRQMPKWTCRCRDMVDDVLVEELPEEERDWTEFWPEEILVVDRVKERTLRRAIREVLNDFQTVLG